MAAPRIAEVLLPLPLPEAFDYAEPEGLVLAVGDLVRAPLGRREVVGVVQGLRPAAGGNRALRAVAERLELPSLPPTTLAFVRWAARYAVESPGQPLAMVLRGLRAPPPRPAVGVVATGLAPARLTPERSRVLALADVPFPAAELARQAGVSAGVITALIAAGSLERTPIPAPPTPETPPAPAPALNASQAAAAEALGETIASGAFAVSLLDGVTGSGKTEVYLDAVARTLAADPRAQALILLPEIALTQAVIARIAGRFAAAPAEWHSGVPSPRRRRVWEAVAAGEARIVVGARSALFLPYRRLRLIVVDEEHDGSFKQEDGFIYHGRDLAVARGRIENCPVILASATPALETFWMASSGRYRWLRLSDRHGEARLPSVELIDMRATPPSSGRWISPPLEAAMRETLAQGEQVLLFLNRRGYAPLVICRACGERLSAPDSDSWLVEHRYSGRLVCHLTGFSMPKPERCPQCQAEGALTSVGPGVERVAEEARSLFPEARLAVFSSDTAPDAASARALIAQVTEGGCDILVATQSAAKGHNFPHLTLVGVVDADLGLRGGDLRAAERTYQLLAQVSGRAGRGARAGRALVQTFVPDHPLMQALAVGDRDAFVAAELAEREAAGLPPFTRLAALIVSGPPGTGLDDFVRTMAAAAPNGEGIDVFGPADAPIALIRGRRRKRFLVRARRDVDLQAYLATWRARIRPPGAIRVTIDVDPYSFL